MMEGRSAESLQAARDMLKGIPLEMFKQMPGFDFVLAVPAQGLSRFGRWKEILIEPMPPAEYPIAVGLWRQARGLALVKTGDVAGAERELAELQILRKGIPPEAKVALNAAGDVLDIATGVLAGEIALAQGNLGAAVASFDRAVTLEDALHYDEPPDWVYPVRHHLGAALLAAGRAAQAEAVYRADLARHPHNGWALIGLQKSLQAEGKTAEAQAAQQQFAEAWKRADVTLTASVF
jgi:tetratricopeptide (TPR) repeat protein